MRTVLYIGAARTWTAALGPAPWPLVPLGNRPLLEYWFELSVDWGGADVHLVLGEGAEQIEAYAGDGSRWGLRIQYGFLRDDRPPLSYLQHNPKQWRDGLLFLSGPLFPRRLTDSGRILPLAGASYLYRGAGGTLCAVCTDAASFAALVEGAPAPVGAFRELGIEPEPLESIKDFFRLNMRLAGGEISRYLAPGYGAADGSCVGYNVVSPPSAEVATSVILGNDCHIGPLASVGPCAVIGNHVMVDQQAQLTRCVVLADTYVGRHVELREKIAVGHRLVDPEDGVVLELKDTWLLARLPPVGEMRSKVQEVCRAVTGGVLAFFVLCLQLVPFAIGYGVLRLCRQGRFERRQVHGPRQQLRGVYEFQPSDRSGDAFGVRLFYALGLDLTPRLAGAVCGQWWLCGHEPLRAPEANALRDELTAYFPAVFSYATARRGSNEPDVAAIEARCYIQNHGMLEDLRIIRTALVGRLRSLFMGERNG